MSNSILFLGFIIAISEEELKYKIKLRLCLMEYSRLNFGLRVEIRHTLNGVLVLVYIIINIAFAVMIEQ